uniref:Uncharacterized protein n=1 Tax=Arundo donax TaxID=35708 RepID=A0A0A9GM73_ARUDO
MLKLRLQSRKFLYVYFLIQNHLNNCPLPISIFKNRYNIVNCTRICLFNIHCSHVQLPLNSFSQVFLTLWDSLILMPFIYFSSITPTTITSPAMQPSNPGTLKSQ